MFVFFSAQLELQNRPSILDKNAGVKKKVRKKLDIPELNYPALRKSHNIIRHESPNVNNFIEIPNFVFHRRI